MFDHHLNLCNLYISMRNKLSSYVYILACFHISGYFSFMYFSIMVFKTTKFSTTRFLLFNVNFTFIYY